jgi:hypothetical protein
MRGEGIGGADKRPDTITREGIGVAAPHDIRP